MGDLLIRNIPEDVKGALRLRAAENGRSQQAEALHILEASLGTSKESWFARLRAASESIGGVDLPVPERHSPRDLGIAL